MKYLFIGPSGSGKTTLSNIFLNKNKNFCLSISYTTRPMRNNEVDGEEYFFITIDKFLSMKQDKQFFETEEIFGNYYGTHVDYFQNQKDVVFNIDVKGALNIKKKYPDSISIFITPPSMNELKKRLINRGDIYIQNRIQEINEEIKYIEYFTYCIINDKLENAIQLINNIHEIENHRIKCKKNCQLHLS